MPIAPAQRNFPVIPDTSRSVQDEFRTLRKMIYDAQDTVAAQAAAIQNLNTTTTTTSPTSPTPASSSSSSPSSLSVPAAPISASVVSATSGVTTNQKQVITTVSGSNPNVTQLIGLLAQVQRAYIPEYSAIPILADPASQNGSLISVNGVLYRFDGSSQPGVWMPQSAEGVISQDTYTNWTSPVYDPASFTAGSLFLVEDWDVLYVVRAGVWAYATGTYEAVAASRPTTGFNGAALGTHDAGLLFLATDTLVFSWWDGAAWNTVKPTGAAAATYGDATHVAQLVVNADGRITTITDIAITFPTAYTTLTITPTTIAALPATPVAGQFATVNNALAPVLGSAVAGTGTAFAAVCWNGAQWTVFSI